MKIRKFYSIEIEWKDGIITVECFHNPKRLNYRQFKKALKISWRYTPIKQFWVFTY